MLRLRDQIAQKVLGIFLIGAGPVFIFVPGLSSVESQSKPKVVTESQQSDIDSITQTPDQSAMSLAVSRLMERPDVTRVRVIKGDIESPEFEIKQGKNKHPQDIGLWVDGEQNGYSLSIGYTATEKAPTSMEKVFKANIMTMVSFVFGMCLWMGGFYVFLFLAKS